MTHWPIAPSPPRLPATNCLCTPQPGHEAKPGFVDKLDQVFAAVAENYPFENYLTDARRYQLRALVDALRGLKDVEHPTLLDVGSGPLDKAAVLQRLRFQCSAVDDLSDPWRLLGDNRA